ncbi:TlpA family protein disulfide reductase [Crocinitomix catalasitica]|uniref:TlpA family protein disulfide reductase n=1 Tax=Crocinitomix catalasitica TaxID=184607 RepID=UPI0004889D6F|nr:TlpA disulfide reductase family protein [Crocinitomix catalasitica]
MSLLPVKTMSSLQLLLLIFTLFTGIFAKADERKNFWHTEFQLTENQVLPVTFYFDETDPSQLIIYNAEERIPLNKIERRNDSIFVKIELFNSELKCKIVHPDTIQGAWFNYNRGTSYSIPFISYHTYQPRFKKIDPTIDIIGKWEVTFNYNSGPTKAIGLFNTIDEPYATKNSNKIKNIKGTFMTETGDYRYLEGGISHDTLHLSTFDGVHAYLFNAKLVNDTLYGKFYSGNHFQVDWFAVRNETFELTNPFDLTYLVNEEELNFSIPDLDNNIYTYPNQETKNKVTLVQLMGTWCPNCLDENNYLKTVAKNFGDDIEIISLAFEMGNSQSESAAKVNIYKESLGLDFTFLIAGKASKDIASELFPMVNKIISFPTLFIIDKQGIIRHIHTGFNGPGTGEYYTHFVSETNLLITDLIQEKVK